MEEKKKISLDDIFNDDDFGLLNEKAKVSNVKSDEERMIDSFQEINNFIDKNEREPSASSMSEYNLLARLKTFRQDEDKKRILKPFDRHDLLGEVKASETSIEDVLNDDDFGLLDIERDLSIFKYKHIPNEQEREAADYVAQRKPLKENEFAPYEKMFQKVHQEIKSGERKMLPFYNIEKNLQIGNFYFIDGVMLYLEDVVFERSGLSLSKETSRRVDGRTKTIFENGTYSNMLYRSLGKQIQKSGKLVTNTLESINKSLFVDSDMVHEEDVLTGWVYILKSKSTDPKIAGIKDLYKIGFTSTPVDDRIKNAKNEATYLFADVTKVKSFGIYNRNANKLEQLLHRFFASACLDVDLFNDEGQRITPREWFVVPLEVIEEAIQLMINEKIMQYVYDVENKMIVAVGSGSADRQLLSE